MRALINHCDLHVFLWEINHVIDAPPTSLRTYSVIYELGHVHWTRLWFGTAQLYLETYVSDTLEFFRKRLLIKFRIKCLDFNLQFLRPVHTVWFRHGTAWLNFRKFLCLLF